MFVVAGGDVTDTVLTVPGSPLVVEVRGEDGRPRSGVVVRFQSVPDRVASHSWTSHIVSLRGAAESPPRPTVFDTTDGTGRASVQIVFGNLAGEGAVSINAPALGLDGRATYTVLPGNAVDVRAVPADTAVYVGGGYAMRGTTVDRWGNARTDPVTYRSPEAHVDLADDGSLAGMSIGRDLVEAVHGEWRDTAWVSVVPRGRLAALKDHVITGDTAMLAEFELDGSDYHETVVPYWADPRPEWLSDGSLVHEDGGTLGGSNNYLVVRDGLDAPTDRLVPAEIGFEREHFAQATVDGTWVYFAGGYPSRQGHTELWRVRPDGTNAERIGEPSGYYEGDTQPSPSPDGSRVAYATDRECCYGLTLRVLDVATGAVERLLETNGEPVSGTLPRWSPNGDVVAYLAQSSNHGNVFANRIWTMRPDGSDRRVISDADRAYSGPFDWSPDGEWLVAQDFDDKRLHVIHRATGLTLPLAYTARLVQPAWHP